MAPDDFFNGLLGVGAGAAPPPRERPAWRTLRQGNTARAPVRLKASAQGAERE